MNCVCFDRCTDGREPKIPTVTVTVKAAAVKPKYILTLGGTTEMVREERDVSHGTAIFRDLLILAVPAVKTSDVRQLSYYIAFINRPQQRGSRAMRNLYSIGTIYIASALLYCRGLCACFSG